MSSAKERRTSRMQAILFTVATLFFTLAVPGHAEEDSFKLYKAGTKDVIAMEFEKDTKNPLVDGDKVDFSKAEDFVKAFGGKEKGTYEPALLALGMKDALLKAEKLDDAKKSLKESMDKVEEDLFWKDKKDSVLKIMEALADLDKEALEDEDFLKNLFEKLGEEESILADLGVSLEAAEEEEEESEADAKDKALAEAQKKIKELEGKVKGAGESASGAGTETAGADPLAPLVGEIQQTIAQVQDQCEKNNALYDRVDALEDQVKDVERFDAATPAFDPNAVQQNDDEGNILDQIVAGLGDLFNRDDNDNNRRNALLNQQPQQQFPFGQQQTEQPQNDNIENPQFNQKQQQQPFGPPPFQVGEFDQVQQPQQALTKSRFIPDVTYAGKSAIDARIAKNKGFESASTLTSEVEGRVNNLSALYGPQVGAGLARMELRGVYDHKADRETALQLSQSRLKSLSSHIDSKKAELQRIKNGTEIPQDVQQQKLAYDNKYKEAKERKKKILKQKQAEYAALGVDPGLAQATLAQATQQLDEDIAVAKANKENYDKHVAGIQASANKDIPGLAQEVQRQEQLRDELQADVTQLEKDVKTLDRTAKSLASKLQTPFFPQQGAAGGITNIFGARNQGFVPASGGFAPQRQFGATAPQSANVDQFRTNFGGQTPVAP